MVNDQRPLRKSFASHISLQGKNLIGNDCHLFLKDFICITIRFFGAYHASRKMLQFAVPQNRETNIVSAAAICITPLIAIASLRPMVPYSIMLVAIDAYNELSTS